LKWIWALFTLKYHGARTCKLGYDTVRLVLPEIILEKMVPFSTSTITHQMQSSFYSRNNNDINQVRGGLGVTTKASRASEYLRSDWLLMM